jgi:hypothetical protein
MNLTELLTAATTGTSILTTTTAARLWTAIADDRTTMHLHGLPETGKLHVTIESMEDDVPVMTVAQTLRYMIDPDGPVIRLCTAPGCLNESAGTGILTRVCYDHLDVIVPGMLPSAGDDILPGDRESAARESRQRRLDAWQAEIESREHHSAGERRVLAGLRDGGL